MPNWKKKTNLNAKLKEIALNAKLKKTALNAKLKTKALNAKLKEMALNTKLKETALNAKLKTTALNAKLKAITLENICQLAWPNKDLLNKQHRSKNVSMKIIHNKNHLHISKDYITSTSRKAHSSMGSARSVITSSSSQ